MSTIFSKIIAGELPSFKVYEDEKVFAFLDINPIQPGHTLVVPKTPSEDALSTNPEDLAHIMVVGQRLAKVIMETTECDGINFLINNGKAAGQVVFHTHLHIIPRFDNDGVYEEPMPGEYENGEAESLAVTIASAIA
ncbi:MAG: HIT family protein [Candidatus Pacebacteria bacterium]|nr:HIT family protein [Candidatus Paceibacterota bacterium]MBP9843086.1 HIT family protein [Candidatus Paceibacterota bacterium]